MSEKSIGKVISVDSFRVVIRLDEDLKSLYKSGYEGIYEVARINSYIIIPVGSDKIVAMVTSVRAIEESEFGKNKEAIFLTKSARHLVATMIGTIESKGKYIQGVYNYPILDNPVWYVTTKDLNCIFDQKEPDNTDKIDFDKDYYLPIGTSPSLADYKIKINPDKFFGKHAAILGNTGSGKSCTLASIIQSMFEFQYNNQELKNAHIIIFDTNGEYKSAFQGSKSEPYKKLQLVNPFHIDKEGMKVPFWFMNFADYEYLFDPSEKSQSPILKRAISIGKDSNRGNQVDVIPRIYIFFIQQLLSQLRAPDYNLRLKIYHELQFYIDDLHSTTINGYDTNEFIAILQKIYSTTNVRLPSDSKYLIGNFRPNDLISLSERLDKELRKYHIHVRNLLINEERNVDLPRWFDFEKLINHYMDNAINELEGNDNKIREFVSGLKLRLQSFLNDSRISEPLMFNQRESIDKVLAKFIAFILGDFCKLYQLDDENKNDLYSNYNEKEFGKKVNKPSQITIIDMSLLPYEVLETITGLIGRIILEFVSRFSAEDRGKLPIVIALEEAQNYIPEKNRGTRESISKKVFERIAREGRKYGISLIVSSQRPSELSKTVLSQCNSFIIHRLQNPEDQKYIRQLVSAANEDILQQLPILPQQHVIIMGDAVRTPVQAKMNTANPKPNSEDPKFIENWVQNEKKNFPDYIGIAEAWERGKKYEPNTQAPNVEEEQ